ncbi:MAG: phenylacetate--CoA ligase family protein [Bacteroidales bacterium]|nr:phenylacetate--CoA ligase family protein [Bacteroidales bacterium]
MSLINNISEKILLPVSDFILRQKISQYLEFLLKSQWFNQDILNDYQSDRLKNLVEHAYKSVPYYKRLFDNLNISPTDIRCKADLTKLPILTKDTIKENLNSGNFIAKNIPKSNLKLKSSSGSTGEPLFYYTTKNAYSMNIASNLRGWYWMGYRLGDNYIKISQNARKNPIKRIQDKISRNLYLASNPLTDKNLRYLLEQIDNYAPVIIRCYPDPLFFLAKYLKNNNDFNIVPKAITTTGNTLFPEVRKQIEDSFNCKVFDAYSCEGNATVFECPSHECYHSTMEYGITEVLNEVGEPITDGIGRLISTDLMNYAQPFIRYDTQDLIEVSSKPCSCGRNLLRINRIIGRNNDILENSEGRKFIVHNFTGFFQQDNPRLNRSIDQFQVIKKKNGLLFNLIVNSNYNDTVNLYIKEYWASEFKGTIEIDTVTDIPLTINGKRKFIINEDEVTHKIQSAQSLIN